MPLPYSEKVTNLKNATNKIVKITVFVHPTKILELFLYNSTD